MEKEDGVVAVKRWDPFIYYYFVFNEYWVYMILMWENLLEISRSEFGCENKQLHLSSVVIKWAKSAATC